MAPKKPPRPRRTARVLRNAVESPVDGAAMVLGSGVENGIPLAADVAQDSSSTDEQQRTKREAFLALARKRWRQSRDAESQLRVDMEEDLRFYNSEQWPDDIKFSRILDGRPCLTINRLPQFVRQVMNQARQNRPGIQVNPIDNGADPDTAEVFQGISRSIERNSKAGMAYMTAGEHQVIMGRGWLRLRADYMAEDSMDQEIIIEAVEDPFTVYPDPAAGKPDSSDMGWGFIGVRLPKHEYKVKYPRATAESISDFTSIGDDLPDWVTEDGVQVLEYYYIESVAATLVECLVNPDTEEERKLTIYREAIKPADLVPDASGLPRVRILRERPTIRRQLKWATINGVEVLEGNDDKTGGRDLPGPFVPLVPMIGEKLVVRGKKNLRGMVRDAKDPQRTYNFWVSAETEMIALAPRAPVIGAVGQFETTKEQWLQANRRNYPYLEYDPIDINGQLVPPPQRNPYDPNLGPIIQATLQSDRDLKSVVGMFDASQERSPEQSGKAIIARQQQGEQGNSHFLTNQALAVEHVGRILLHWIPVYYSVPKILRIIGLDDREQDVLVHAGNEQAATAMLEDPLYQNVMKGRPFDLSVGRYDVTISVQPSYASRRQEGVDAMVQLVQAFPGILPFIADKLVGNMDWPGAKEVAKRLEAFVPPEARDQKPGEQAIPPEVQQQMQAMQQQLEMAMAKLQEQEQLIATKAQELAAQGAIRQMELDSAERIAVMKSELEITKIQAKLEADKALALLEGKMKELSQRMEQLHQERMRVNEQDFQARQVEREPAAGAEAGA